MKSGFGQQTSHSIFYAHTEGANGSWEPLRKHLIEVATKAAEFARPFGAANEAYNAGLLHDFGKYGDLFQLRLQGKAEGIDHWSAGAWKAMNTPYGAAVAMAAQGHHVGLQRGDRAALRMLGRKQGGVLPPQLKFSQPDAGVEILASRFAGDGLTLRSTSGTLMDGYGVHCASAMLDMRMLFSALVDADFLATESHFEGKVRPEPVSLNCEAMLERLSNYVDNKSASSTASPELNGLRHQLRECCRASAELAPGVFTLTAPTGSGKTLAMLEFALRHVKRNGLRRIVAVAPYLSIIDQTVDVYREALQIDDRDQSTLLEHHSLVIDKAGSDDSRRMHERLAENWDASIVLTTSVQLLESLFSNRPGACRKLHRLANSVILFDEVQTFPLPLVTATLGALSRLAQRYKVTIVFATATQPAFKELSDVVSRYVRDGWHPREINADACSMFSAAKRVNYRWPSHDERSSWEEVACRLCDGTSQALCIVNTKKQSEALYEAVAKLAPGCFHLSTAMCPAHRRQVIADCTARLDVGESCVLIATQCVEAGVDLDFPRVFRALGPLDSIAQAAGRCNRHQRRAFGEVEIFRPLDEQWPADEVYKSAAALAWKLRGCDLHNPETFVRYYADLYRVQSLDQLDSAPLYEALRAYDFVAVAKEYRLIKDNSVNVLSPYGDGVELATEVRNGYLTAAWARRARSFSINVPRWQVEKAPELFEPVPLADRSIAEDWRILRADAYSIERGFMFTQERVNYQCV